MITWSDQKQGLSPFAPTQRIELSQLLRPGIRLHLSAVNLPVSADMLLHHHRAAAGSNGVG